MSGGTIAAIGVGVVAVGAGVYFLMRRNAAPPLGAPIAGAPAPVYQAGTGTAAPLKSAVTSFVDMNHVDRKNAVAPIILGKFGIPSSVASPIASIAGKLDVSGYAERYVSKVPVVGTVAAIPTKVASSVIHGITSLF